MRNMVCYLLRTKINKKRLTRANSDQKLRKQTAAARDLKEEGATAGNIDKLTVIYAVNK